MDFRCCGILKSSPWHPRVCNPIPNQLIETDFIFLRHLFSVEHKECTLRSFGLGSSALAPASRGILCIGSTASPGPNTLPGSRNAVGIAHYTRCFNLLLGVLRFLCCDALLDVMIPESTVDELPGLVRSNP